MNQLRILRLHYAGSGCWAVRFGGERDDFTAMVDDLKWAGCRWNPEALGGRGAWMMGYGALLIFKDRFENLEQCLEREQLRQKLEQQRQALAAIEQSQHELGIERDIDEVPF